MNIAPGGPRPASGSRRIAAISLVTSLTVLLLIAAAIWGLSPNDLRVYHSAVGRLVTDDVYEFDYPDWPFTYPPSALLALAPTGLALSAARILMFLGSITAVLVTVRLTIRSSAPGSAWDRLGPVTALSALALLTWPFLLGSALGQVAPIVMGMTAVGVLGRESRWNGVWLGTAVAIKLTPAAFWLFWGVVGRWRAALVSVGTFLAWTVAAALIMPRSSWWYFVEGGAFRAQQDYAYLSNQALTGVAARVRGDDTVGRVVALVVSALALVVALAVAKRLHDAGWTAVAVGLVGIWSGISAPLAWTHAFVWWAPLAIAVWLCGRSTKDMIVAILVYLAPFLVLVGPLDAPAPFSLVEQAQGATYAMIAVAVTAYLTWRVRSVPRSALDPESPSGAFA